MSRQDSAAQGCVLVLASACGSLVLHHVSNIKIGLQRTFLPCSSPVDTLTNQA